MDLDDCICITEYYADELSAKTRYGKDDYLRFLIVRARMKQGLKGNR